MSFLKTLQKTSRLRPFKAVIYGQAGIGKTTFASQCPNSIIFDCNDGLDGIDTFVYPPRDNDPDQVFKTIHEVYKAIGTLYTEEHDFQALVVDSLTDIQNFIWNQICLEHNVTNIAAINYGKGYEYALSYWDQLLDGFSALRDRRGMMIILLCHSDTHRYDDPMADSGYDRYTLKLHKKAAEKVREWADTVLFFDQKTFINKQDAGFNKKISKAVGGTRVLFTSEDPRHLAKNRYNLPPEIMLLDRDAMWQTFIGELNRSVTKNRPQAEVVPVAEATAPAQEQPPAESGAQQG